MENISHADKRTILFVSHNMTAIRRLCDRCVVLERGQPSRTMSVDDAVEYYSSRHATSAAKVPLDDRARDGRHGRIARLLELNIENGRLVYGRPGFVTVTFDLKEHTKELMVGVGFDTLEGQRLLSLDSDTDAKAWDLKPGRYTVRVGLEYWPLQPGSYAVSTAIFTGHNCLDAANSTAIWEVQTSAADNLSDRGNGAVRVKPISEITTAT